MTKYAEEEPSLSLRTDNDILNEILYTVRGLESRLNRLENNESAAYKINVQENKFSESNPPLFAIGDTVEHRVFGIGCVEHIRPMGRDFLIDVDFEKAGLKKMMQNFAKLEKI